MGARLPLIVTSRLPHQKGRSMLDTTGAPAALSTYVFCSACLLPHHLTALCTVKIAFIFQRRESDLQAFYSVSSTNPKNSAMLRGPLQRYGQGCAYT